MTKIKANLKNISSLYIHFPFCRHLCNYCDFYKFKLNDSNQISSFEGKLLEQIIDNNTLISNYGYEFKPLDTLYIGGGTPSLWSHAGAAFIKNHIIQHIKLAPDCEFTIEIDPGTWTPSEIGEWIKIGVNRFSIGIQAFDEKFKNHLDRAHTMDEAKELLEYMKVKKFNFSVDLMLGLPFSEVETRDIDVEIEELSKYDPSHFSVYILKTRANYLHTNNLPSDDYTAIEYENVCRNLEGRGYEQYEVSNFAKASRRSKHNLKYWKSESVASLGSNATGLLNLGESGVRYQWKSVGVGASIEEIGKDSFLIEKIYMSLRSCLGLEFKIFSQTDQARLKNIIENWSKHGYVKSVDDKKVVLNSNGYIILDSLMDDIFRELSV
jgi:oxygen-independent coproporphyrinogen-3 oxidase